MSRFLDFGNDAVLKPAVAGALYSAYEIGYEGYSVDRETFMQALAVSGAVALAGLATQAVKSKVGAANGQVAEVLLAPAMAGLSFMLLHRLGFYQADSAKQAFIRGAVIDGIAGFAVGPVQQLWM